MPSFCYTRGFINNLKIVKHNTVESVYNGHLMDFSIVYNGHLMDLPISAIIGR